MHPAFNPQPAFGVVQSVLCETPADVKRHRDPLMRSILSCTAVPFGVDPPATPSVARRIMKRSPDLQQAIRQTSSSLTRMKKLKYTTTKVTPLELTTKLMEAAEAKGAELRIAKVSGVSTSPMEEEGKGGEGERRITAVVLEDGAEIPCDRVRIPVPC